MNKIYYKVLLIPTDDIKCSSIFHQVEPKLMGENLQKFPTNNYQRRKMPAEIREKMKFQKKTDFFHRIDKTINATEFSRQPIMLKTNKIFSKESSINSFQFSLSSSFKITGVDKFPDVTGKNGDDCKVTFIS